MESTPYYCRNSRQDTSSTQSISSPLSSNCGSFIEQELLACNSSHTQSALHSKDLVSRNVNNKLSTLNRNIGSTYGISSCNSSGYCTNNSTIPGNYNNLIPVPLDTLQYNRKKSTSQEYQSRLYYNSNDVKCRDDFYSNANAGRFTTGSITPQSQDQVPSQEYYQQHSQQQSHHLLQPLHQIHQQLNQNNISHHQLQNHQQQSICSPTSETNGCTLNGSARVAATQTHQNSNNNLMSDQIMTQAPVSLGLVTVPAPPMLYTVHRVVTTAQIQTAVGSTFASATSVSSVVSSGRNSSDCMASTQVSSAMTLSGNGACHSGLSEISGPITSLRSPHGILANTAFMPVQQKCSTMNEVEQNPAALNRISTTGSSSNSSYLTSGKVSSLVTRALQNVIPTCVYLMSRVAVHMEIEGTGQCPTQVMLAAALGCEELGISNKLLAQSIFGLWMTSTLLEMQLKAHHCPYIVRVAWPNLLEKFSSIDLIDRKFDEPMIVLKRNVFFSKRDEEKIKDHRILELLYEEAKHNVLTGRYIMEPVHSLMLGGIQARIELGPYNSHTHTVGFFRENQSRFLPSHVAKSTNWLWFPVSRQSSAEVKLLDQFKRVPQTATTRKLMRKYLEFCWALPFYGAAFFHGQVEQPVRGIMTLVNHKDVEVLIAVNERGIFIIDPIENTLLLGLQYEDMSWDYAKPSANDDLDCLKCIFLQFDAVENGVQISKLVQIFSKQAAMIDALISHFTEQIKKKKLEESTSEQFHEEPNPIQNSGNGVLCNKLSRLTLATFDEEGRCIGQMGSLSISY